MSILMQVGKRRLIKYHCFFNFFFMSLVNNKYVFCNTFFNYQVFCFKKIVTLKYLYFTWVELVSFCRMMAMIHFNLKFECLLIIKCMCHNDRLHILSILPPSFIHLYVFTYLLIFFFFLDKFKVYSTSDTLCQAFGIL